MIDLRERLLSLTWLLNDMDYWKSASFFFPPSDLRIGGDDEKLLSFFWWTILFWSEWGDHRCVRLPTLHKSNWDGGKPQRYFAQSQLRLSARDVKIQLSWNKKLDTVGIELSHDSDFFTVTVELQSHLARAGDSQLARMTLVLKWRITGFMPDSAFSCCFIMWEL